MEHSATLAYIIGVALGDGNLSCPNGRATRLRITCDNRYPVLINEITSALKMLFPKNKVSPVPGPKPTYCNISVYSNQLNEIMPWRVGVGSKFVQMARVPQWILKDSQYCKHCLRGLMQTDGSIYSDRGYLMANFTNIIKPLAEDVSNMITILGHHSNLYKTMQKTGNFKYTVRVSKQTASFLQAIDLHKN